MKRFNLTEACDDHKSNVQASAGGVGCGGKWVGKGLCLCKEGSVPFGKDSRGSQGARDLREVTEVRSFPNGSGFRWV